MNAEVYQEPKSLKAETRGRRKLPGSDALAFNDEDSLQ
jgi:hypothetical protein